MQLPDEGARFYEAGPDGMAAWVETREDVDTLLVAAGERVLFERSLARADTLDYGYEGCRARFLHWYERWLVVVSTEKSHVVRSFDSADWSETELRCGWSWAIAGDVFVWLDGEPGLVMAARFPRLEPLQPLPYRGAVPDSGLVVRVADDGLPELVERTSEKHLQKLGRPAALADGAIVEEVGARLFGGSVPAGARLVIETALFVFLRGGRLAGRWEPTPAWLPAYWLLHLRAQGRDAEAAELVDSLRAMGAHGRGDEGDAVRHVRWRAQVLAEVCRTGALPAGWWCLLFHPAPGNGVVGSRVDLTRYPPLMRAVFAEIAAAGPGKLKESW